MMAASRIGVKVEEMDAITSRLTQTNLAEDDSRSATDPTVEAAEIEPIASQVALENDSVDLVSESARQKQEAEAVAKTAAVKQKKAARKQKRKAAEKTSAALSTAFDNWSITEDEGAKVNWEAQETQERIRQEHADHLQALEDAEAKREADATKAAVLKRLLEARAQERQDKKNREAEEAKGKEAAQQKQAEADALAVTLAERRAAQDREWREQELANQARAEADYIRRQQLSQAYSAYKALIAQNAALAEANAREWQNSQQQRAEYLAHYHAVASGQGGTAELVQQQQQHHHQPEQQQQQQQPSNFGSYASEMEVTVEEDVAEGTQAAEEMDIDSEPVEIGSPLPAQLLVPSVPSAEVSNVSLESEPAVIAAPPPASGPDRSAGPETADTLKAVSPKRVVAKAARRKDRARIKAARASSPPSASPPSAPPPSPYPPSAPIRPVLVVAIPRAPINPVIRPMVHPWSPLGRLLSQGQSMPQVARSQVLGKREREDMDEVGPEKKKAKLEGEFQYQVGGKRKLEDEDDLPEKKRVRLDPALPTLAPPVVPAIGLGSSTTAPTQPITAAIPLPANLSSSLAETIAFVNDLPTLRAEIAWMRSHRTFDNSGKATRGKKTRTNPSIKPGYWEKYREN